MILDPGALALFPLVAALLIAVPGPVVSCVIAACLPSSERVWLGPGSGCAFTAPGHRVRGT